MKAIVCEMCGSQDLVKKDGFYICQNCGTKYAPEEAKKLMIEVSGTVDISGSTVQIDNSSFVEKYLQNARRAREKEDWEETEKYYNMVEQNDPDNIEAIFYSSFAKAKITLTVPDFPKRKAAFKSFQNSISIIDDNYDVSKESETKALIMQMSSDIVKMCNSPFVWAQEPNVTYVTVTKNPGIGLTHDIFRVINNEFATTLQNIANKFPEARKSEVLYLYKCAIENYRCACSLPKFGDTPLDNETAKIKIDSLASIISKYDSNYLPPSTKSGGCYVATAVYGSYDCPQVWTLRRYRDYTLAETWYGRAFIHSYYAISPTLVKWFGETQWFKNMWKPKLDKMVKRLNEEGVADTPYQDRNW